MQQGFPSTKALMAVCPSEWSQRSVARGLQRAFGKLPSAGLQVTLAALQPWRSQPGSSIPLPGPSQSLGEKEILTCNGDKSHLFLILDDADAPYAEDWVDTAFVPQGNPRVGKQPWPLFGGENLYVCRLDHVFPRPATSPQRSLQKDQAPRCNGNCPHLCLITFVPAGLLGEVPKRSPVAEHGLDARGPEIWKETSRTGRYSQRLSHVLKKIMKEKAAHEADGEPEHRDAFQAGSRRTAHVPPGETEAKHTTGAPVLLEPQEAQYNWIRGFFLKNPGVDDEGRANTKQVKDAQKLYLELAASVPVSLLLVMILCCVLFWWCRKRKQRLAAADGARDDSSSYSSPSEEESADLEWPDRRTNHQPSVREQPAHQPQGTSRAAPARLNSHRAQLPPPRPPRPRIPGSASRGISDRPSSPRPQRASTPPPRPPPPSFKGQKEPAGGRGLRSSASTKPIAPQQMRNRPSSPRPQRASTPPPRPPPPSIKGQKEPAGGRGLRSSASTKPIAPQQLSDRPSSPRPQQASTPPPRPPPPSFRGQERSPQHVGSGASSSTWITAASGEPERPSSPQPPPAPPLPPSFSPSSFRRWEQRPQVLSSGASSHPWKTTARGKQTRPGSPQIPPAPPLPSPFPPSPVREWKRSAQSADLGKRSDRTAAARGKQDRPSSPRPPRAPSPASRSPLRSFRRREWPPQASPLPSPSSPPSFRRWEQPPRGLGLGELSSRPTTAAWGKREQFSSPQPPRAPSSPSPQASFRWWEWPPRGVSSGASLDNWKTTARGKQTWASSPQHPPALHLPFRSPPLSIGR
ncbi:serine/arginine repetitive matrix protein 1-like isoform X1 [Centrocercus urophasianus]|uniref:serine/arginine repetitive matrix protein 1-like isoform X1 n=1 Tax=Centrocercus urophasianus TaxID=9002 RepID=UPI001C64C840|nr:serine/arginine repetitive matrix protein 1-like isoform X1 [Centrocercus urophasianus]